ncbi:unnamed protein product, partial [Prorocentrum cordatum]
PPSPPHPHDGATAAARDASAAGRSRDRPWPRRGLAGRCRSSGRRPGVGVPVAVDGALQQLDAGDAAHGHSQVAGREGDRDREQAALSGTGRTSPPRASMRQPPAARRCAPRAATEAVRLALLDERPREPRERGAEQPLAGRGSAAASPKCSARSAGPSTEAAWSTTPPSQCDSPTSARSQRPDSGRGGCGADDAAEASAPPQRQRAWTVGGAEGLQHSADPSRFHLDLQKRLEVIRFVTMRENQKLKDAVQQVREQIARRGLELGCDPHAGRPPPPPPASTPPPRWPQRVHWRVDGAALSSGAPPPRHGLALPGCPGVSLELALEPAPGAAQRGAAGASSSSAPRAAPGRRREETPKRTNWGTGTADAAWCSAWRARRPANPSREGSPRSSW